ncbi:argininosuccinate lyase [Egibacter rhizosphaerae]|uniref:Argininosuccinate lyase n=1 Tax=Egibacter rhizosphaerae TaxID=1670831 RepID=A0A411YK59_9ACTN|nr:argininosuccinate lyase [Egibacter rhizosphaerae]QBI21573.1 argininosuccinate lyase [Egibacter rhizosphaerae]
MPPDSSEQGRLWGGRFGEEPDAAAWALGRDPSDRRLWRQDLAGSRAHADELLRLGILSHDDHAAITAGLEQIAEEFAEGRFAFRADDEDLHGAIERRLLEISGEVGGRLRAGRSRNDQIASDLKLYLAEAIDGLLSGLRGLQAALVDQAEACVDWLAPGYTHLQRAQPVTLGHHLLAHAWALDRDAERLAGARARALAQSPLGSGALAGLTLELDPARYAAALGFDGPAPNSMDAIADRDTSIEFLAAAATLGMHLSRLGEEIVLWASEEFGWVRVGDAFSTGSSIMPQKRNPDVAELVRGKSGRLVGDLVSLLVTLKGLPLAYNRDLQEDKPPVFDAVDTLELTLPAMAGTVQSLAFDRERLASNAAGGFALATDVAEALVRRGVPFRVAHERVGEAVSALERDGVDLQGLAPERLAELLPELADAPDLGDAAAAVARRAASLGPAPERVAEQARVLRARLSVLPPDQVPRMGSPE